MGDIHIRKDIHQTSTGVGHHYRPGYYFPSSNFKVCSFDILDIWKFLYFHVSNDVVSIMDLGLDLTLI